jgi:hypothetical protein
MISSSYATDWAAAVARCERFGLDMPAHDLQPSRRFLTAARHAEFPHVVQRGLGDLDFPDVVSQCLSIHYQLAPVLEQWLGCPVMFTLGWVDDGTPKGMYKFDDTFVAEKLKHGNAGLTINIHAWLTLPSMEVIDVSLATTIARVQKLEKGHGAVLAMQADEIKGFAYKPMLVGSDFLRKAGLLVDQGSPAHQAKLNGSGGHANPR